jgi:predicted dehydrogenase
MVAIGSPSGLHGEHGIAAARRGLHVLVEKPIEVSTARADALIAETARAGVTLGVIFQDRLKPAIVALKRLVESGALGKPILAAARIKWHRAETYYRESHWRGTWGLDGGGALINQAVHTVDLLLWCCGPVRRIWGRAATRLHAIEVEDTATAVVEFASGALATIEATTAAFPGYARRLEVTGAEGTVILDGDRLVAVDLRGSSEAPDDPEPPPASASSPVVPDATAHQRVFEDFIRAFTTGTPPCCDGREGRRSVEVIEAIYESSRLARPIELTQEEIQS